MTSIFYLLNFISKDAFMYKSLFFYYLLIFLSCGLFIYPFLKSILARTPIIINLSVSLFTGILLIALPFIIKVITGESEWYFLFYFVSVFVLYLGISINISNGFNIIERVNILLIGFGLCESIICFLQYGGVIASSKFFPVSGTNSNPNITAMFLVMILPIVIHSFFERNNKAIKFLLFIITLCTLIAIILLKSRTAYIGIAVVILSLLLKYLIFSRKRFRYLGYIFVFGFLAISLLLLPKLYAFKQNSAEGRQFIWKTSLKMIAAKPVTGYGYGMIQGAYNKAQADFFQQQITTESEKQQATYTTNLFNDYLEMFVQGGMPGGCLYGIFIISLLISGWKLRHSFFYPFIGVLVFAIMSCSNFAFYSPSVVVVFVYFAAIIGAKNRDSMILPKNRTVS